MQVNKNNAKYQEPKLKPLNYKEFVKFYVVKVDDQPITEVYKRINKF